MIPIYKTFDHNEIAFIKSLLIDAEIPFFVDNENAAGIAFGQTIGLMTVSVPETAEQAAKELLKDFIDSQENPGR